MEIHEKKVEVSIYPNPFAKQTTILLHNALNSEDIENLSIELYDVLGRKKEIENTIMHRSLTIIEIKLHRDDLSSGLYFYTIDNKSAIIASGKLIVQ